VIVCMIIYRDEKFGFFELFNEKNGTLIRGDVAGEDPIMRSFPELLDVGIMGHCDFGEYCSNAGVDCYQQGQSIKKPHMALEDFETIVTEADGKTFQIALGGAGDPNKHPDFEKMLLLCRQHNIVPNITTSGYAISEHEIEIMNKYCGAVAVSWYSRLINGQENNLMTVMTTRELIDKGIITNIHYVVSKQTLLEAITRLENDMFPSGINAVVFILYKPVGYGRHDKVLTLDESDDLKHFFELVSRKHPYQIGFDTCFTPAIVRWGKCIAEQSIDACEAALFSMYIDSQMNCFPCSFGIWSHSEPETLKDKSIREVWEGSQFNYFRSIQKNKCSICSNNIVCRTGCRLGLNIDLC